MVLRIGAGDSDREILVVFIDYSSFFNTNQSRVVDMALGERGASVAFRRLLHVVGRGRKWLRPRLGTLLGHSPIAVVGIRVGLVRRGVVALHKRGSSACSGVFASCFPVS